MRLFLSMESIFQSDDFDRPSFCIYSLVKIWNSINLMYESDSDISSMRDFKEYLCLNDKASDIYDKLIQNTFSIINRGIHDYCQIYLYLKNNSSICSDYLKEKKRLLKDFTLIIKKIISYFDNKKQCQLFNITNFIKNEISECFYQMYSLYRISSPRHAQICLEKSSKMNNYKALFELGLITLKEGSYLSAYQHFFECSEFLTTEPCEICYPPSMFMIGFMYYLGLYVRKDLELSEKIFQMSSELNEYQPDNNFLRAQMYLSELNLCG